MLQVQYLKQMKRHNKVAITTIAFDYGDVLVTDAAKKLEGELGFNQLPAKAKKEYHRAWYLSETGRRPTTLILQTIKKLFDLDLSTRQIHQILFSPPVIKPVWKIALKLSRKYKIALLTNNLKHGPEIQAKFNHISLRGLKIYNSAVIGFHKPSLSFFKYFLKDIDRPAKSILFIDDRAENVAAAKKLGIKAFRFDGNVRLLIANLKKFGVKVKIS